MDLLLSFSVLKSSLCEIYVFFSMDFIIFIGSHPWGMSSSHKVQCARLSQPDGIVALGDLSALTWRAWGSQPVKVLVGIPQPFIIHNCWWRKSGDQQLLWRMGPIIYIYIYTSSCFFFNIQTFLVFFFDFWTINFVSRQFWWWLGILGEHPN